LFHGIYFNMCLVKWILTLNCSRSSYTFPKQLEQDQPERGSLSAEAKGVKLWEVLCRWGEVGKSFAARTTLPLFMEQHGSVKGSSRRGFGEKHIWELILVITSLKSRYRTIIGCDMMYSVSSDSLVDFSKMLELHRLASPHPFKLRPGKLRKSLCRMWLKPLTQTHTGWDDTDS